MNHSELVQAATDLMAESQYSAEWLGAYDSALASSMDDELFALTKNLQAAKVYRGRAAA